MQEVTAVRQGEELVEAGLKRFLSLELGLETDRVEILQFPAGSSNLTYLIRVNGDEYVLRRPPFGNTVRTAHDMGREFNVLSSLSAVYKPAPKPLAFCDDPSFIGSEFYLMERRKGLVIRGLAPAELQTSPPLQLRVCESFIKNLADLHALDHDAAGLRDLGRPDGYVRRQVEGWTRRYFAAKTDEWPELESAITWLNNDMPAASGASLVHNDYKFDNIMLDPADLTRVAAVLDWEMVTVGDPLMDLGTTLGYWMAADAGEEMLNMPFHPRVLMENIPRQQLAGIYASVTGRDLSNILFYYVFGTVKIAVICQQIYARYKKGFTQDKRFASFDNFVGALGRIAWHACQTGKI